MDKYEQAHKYGNEIVELPCGHEYLIVDARGFSGYRDARCVWCFVEYRITKRHDDSYKYDWIG